MVDLESAGRRLAAQPPAEPAPIEHIRDRSGQISKRRRATRLGAVAAAVGAAAVVIAVVIPGQSLPSQRLRTTSSSAPATSLPAPATSLPAPATSLPSPANSASPAAVSAAHLRSSGFGVAATWQSPNGQLWTTTDSVHWTNVTPHRLSGYVDDVYATDARHLWAITSGCSAGGGNDTVWSSADGGSSWSSASVAGEVCAAGSTALLDFANSLDGWVVVLDPTGPVAHLYASTDGGRTWSSTIDRLPELGEVSFHTALDGYLGGPQLSGSYSRGLYVTHDGGHTWSPVQIKLPPGSLSWQPIFGAPTFTGPSTGVLPVTLVQAGRQQVAWYTTTDGGGTWTLRSGPRPLGLAKEQVDVRRAALTRVADTRTWWAVARAPSGTLTEVTHDGGATWKTETVHAAWVAERVAAADDRSAWLTTSDGQLLTTTDAGASWAVATLPSITSPHLSPGRPPVSVP